VDVCISVISTERHGCDAPAVYFFLKSMVKKIIALVSCVLLTFAACVVWNMAPEWGKATDTNVQLFDAIAVILLFTALCCSVFYYDKKNEQKDR